jgi:hypothetical protein
MAWSGKYIVAHTRPAPWACPCRISFTGCLMMTFDFGEAAAVIMRRIRKMIVD